MEILIFFCILPVVLPMTYKEQYIDQTIDHFSFGTYGEQRKTFKQKYIITEDYWEREQGPIFLYTGNEAPIDVFFNSAGFVFAAAKQFKALVVFAEHRYYGESLPFGREQSFTQPYIQYLTIEQALADYAVLIDTLKYQYNASHCPIIAFGGSYGGQLTAYMRFKYPNLVAGGIASSAPIYLVAGQSEREFFFEDVTRVFANTTSGCDVTTREAFTQLYTLSQTQQGLQEISQVYNLCPPITNHTAFVHFIGWIRNAFASLAMFNFPYPSTVMQPLPAFPVKESCRLVTSAEKAYQGLAGVTELFYGNASCHDVWRDFVECADPTGCGDGAESKAWDYQACTEVIMPAGTNNVTDMFPPLSFTLMERAAYCNKTWGVTPRNNWINLQLWGKDISTASNLVFSNGGLDPWHRGGVSTNVSDSVVALFIKDGAHHFDLEYSHPSDSASVLQARHTELSHIATWLT